MSWIAIAALKGFALAAALLAGLDPSGSPTAAPAIPSIVAPAVSSVVDLCTLDLGSGLPITPVIRRIPGLALELAAPVLIESAREHFGVAQRVGGSDGGAVRDSGASIDSNADANQATAVRSKSRGSLGTAGVQYASAGPQAAPDRSPARVPRNPERDGAERTGDASVKPADGEGRDRGVKGRHSSAPEVSIAGEGVTVPHGEVHSSDIVSFGDKIVVDGESRGDVFVIGGRLELSGTVHGDVVVIGGVAWISGTVHGDVSAVASRLRLDETARIEGSCNNILGRVERAPGSRISRDFHSVGLVNLGWFATGRGAMHYLLLLALWIGLVGTAVRFLGVLVVSALASSNVEGALSPPRPSWILAFLLGLGVHLGALCVNLLLIALCLTLPVAVVLGIAVRVVKWMGLSAIYLLIGRRIGRTVLGRELSYFASILLGFLILAIIGFVPILGWLTTAVLSVTGLGLMLLTQFGTKRSRTVPESAAPGAATTPLPSPVGGGR